MAYTITSNWSISSQLIIDEAVKKNLKTKIINKNKNLYAVFHPENNQAILFKASAIMQNNVVGSRIADFKDLTYDFLKEFVPQCPLAKTVYINQKDDLQKVIKENGLNFPLVVKPLDGAHGEKVTINIKDKETLKKSLLSAFAYNNNNQAIIQEMCFGDDYRVLVVGYKVVAVSKRIPAFVIGDGKQTINELVIKENQHPLRGKADHDKPLSAIAINDETLRILKEKNMTINTIPQINEVVYLKATANLSTGGIAHDFTKEINLNTKKLAEEIAKKLKLGILAVDFISTDISKSLNETSGVLIEINDTPGLRMHHYPYKGKARNVAREIINFTISSND